MNRVNAALGAAIACAIALVASPALAATATNSLSVSATVAKNCTLGAGTIAFGNYDPVGANVAAPLNQAGSFTVTCTKGVAYTVSLGLGNNASGSTRRMTNGTDFLTYELYLDAARTTVWDAANVAAGSAPNISPITLTVYGQVAAGQNVGVGSYSDTVVSTVNF
jgi:spore coat protein U-like protein